MYSWALLARPCCPTCVRYAFVHAWEFDDGVLFVVSETHGHSDRPGEMVEWNLLFSAVPEGLWLHSIHGGGAHVLIQVDFSTNGKCCSEIIKKYRCDNDMQNIHA